MKLLHYLLAFFKTHKRLRKENAILRERNDRQYWRLYAIERSLAVQWQQGFDAAMQVNYSEMSLLHKEIQEMNDLLRSK